MAGGRCKPRGAASSSETQSVPEKVIQQPIAATGTAIQAMQENYENELNRLRRLLREQQLQSEAFAADARLVFKNCMTYTPSQASPYHQSAKSMMALFDRVRPKLLRSCRSHAS